MDMLYQTFAYFDFVMVAIGQEKCEKITKDLVHLFSEENNHVNEGFGHCNYI